MSEVFFQAMYYITGIGCDAPDYPANNGLVTNHDPEHPPLFFQTINVRCLTGMKFENDPER